MPKKNEDGLLIGLLSNNSNDIIIPKQKEIDLKEGDVIFTDDKSSITLKNKDNKLIIEAEEIIFKAKRIKIMGGSIEHDGIKIDKNHKHKYTQQGSAVHSATPPSIQETQTPL